MPVALYCSVVPFAIIGFVGKISTGCTAAFGSFVPAPPPPPQAERRRDTEKNSTYNL
jgi:hypothetical protein